MSFSESDFINAWRYLAIFASVALLYVIIFTGSRVSIMRQFSFINHKFVAIGAGALFLIYGYLSSKVGADISAEMRHAALVAIPPVLFMCVPTYYLVAKEWIKETRFYRDHAVNTKGGERSRTAGIKTFLKMDYTSHFNAMRKRIKRTKYSVIYLGETLWRFDFKIGKRIIGLVSETHLLLVAGSGAGKSRDFLANNLKYWNGGAVVLDIKGEHANYNYWRRNNYAKSYLLDPYNITDSSLPRAKWNPLASIDPESPYAVSEVNRLTEAVIPKEAFERAADKYFREMPQAILAGYIAHVRTAYPIEQQHLGTVYDLLMKGVAHDDNSNFEVLNKEYDKHAELIKINQERITLAEEQGEDEKIKPLKRDIAISEKAMAKIFNREAVAAVGEALQKNEAIGGLPKAAARVLEEAHEKALSQIFMDLTRALRWVNNPVIRALICTPETFNIADCKTKEATVYLCIPKKQLSEMNRFTRLFYQCAFDVLDEVSTPQPFGSERRVLMVFDELEALGYFEPIKECFLRDRSSYLKAVAVFQSVRQAADTYRLEDLTSNSDKVFFGIDATDELAKEMIENAAGKYVIKKEGSNGFEEKERAVIPRGQVPEILSKDGHEQIVITQGGKLLRLARVPVFVNFPNHMFQGLKHRLGTLLD